MSELLNTIENSNNINVNNFLAKEELEKKQNNFIKSKIGQAINGGINIALKAVLPNCIEDEVIAVKDSLITEGFSAAVDTAIDEAVNVGRSLTGIVTGNFENISQVKKAIDKGGLIDTISDLIDAGIKWSNKRGYISNGIASTIKEGKNTIMNIIENKIGETFDKQIEAVEKMDGYIEKWSKYYEERNFQNMEYQYDKIQEYLQETMPLEQTLKKARTVENLHQLIKNNGKNFNITQEEKELANMLAN